MTWGRLLCYDFHTIDALGMGSVCHIYTIVHFYKGQQGAPIIFPVQSWHEAALRQGRVSLITKIFQKKMFVPLHFFQAREG